VLQLPWVALLRKVLLKPGGSEGQNSEAAQRYTGATFMTVGHLEGIGIFGLVHFILSGNKLVLLAFLALAAGSMFLFRPNKETLLELDRRMKSMDSE
jgi:hypothetical protein